jgi:hypothetical protein
MMTKNLFTDNFSEPYHGETTAKFNIHAGDGNLTIERLFDNEQMLISGALQYFENQEPPRRSCVSSNDQVALILSGSRSVKPWLHLPWAACNGATEWLIHLNPRVSSDIAARSNGGNIRLNLTDMSVSHVLADTGGGNIDVILPDNAPDLNAAARTGAGNVTIKFNGDIIGNNIINASSGAGNVFVRIPSGIAARVHATTGLGKAIVDTQFIKIDNNTYQSPDFDSATNKVEITVKSGAGNVSVSSI